MMFGEDVGKGLQCYQAVTSLTEHTNPSQQFGVCRSRHKIHRGRELDIRTRQTDPIRFDAV
jgi:hypothetical protein